MEETLAIATREEMKAEGLKRMKTLGIMKETINQLKDEDLVSMSERNGGLYWLDEQDAKLVKDIEKKYDGYVYFCIKSATEFGMMLSCLWVSKYKEEWEMDNEDIRQNMVFAYVHNYDAEFCSEFGTIGVRQFIGGLMRTY